MDKSDANQLYEHHVFEVEKKHDLIRIDKFLLLRIANTSRTKIQKSISQGHVFCNEQIVKSNYKVKPFDKISICFEHEPYDKEIKPEDIPLDIVFEDSDVIVINKPSNMVVHPSYGHYTGTLVHALLYKYKDIQNTGDSQRPGLVHRLDKDTTGLMVVARNSISLSHLAAQFAERTIKRKYYALVWGDLKDEEGTIIANIGRNKKNRKLMTTFSNNEDGKYAVTHYKVKERFRYITLIECRLETGRTHQIRVHMAHINYPILGDQLYGGRLAFPKSLDEERRQMLMKFKRQALHAFRLNFKHPITDKMISLTSPIPDDMDSMIIALSDEKLDSKAINAYNYPE